MIAINVEFSWIFSLCTEWISISNGPPPHHCDQLRRKQKPIVAGCTVGLIGGKFTTFRQPKAKGSGCDATAIAFVGQTDAKCIWEIRVRGQSKSSTERVAAGSDFFFLQQKASGHRLFATDWKVPKNITKAGNEKNKNEC